MRNTRKIIISEGFIRGRIADLEGSIFEIKGQIKLPDQSNKKRKRLMRGLAHVKGRLRELYSILGCMSSSSTMHLVEVN